MALDPAFGSFDFSASNVALEEFEDVLLVDSSYEDRVQHDGSIMTHHLLQGRDISLRGIVGGTSQANARTNLSDMISAFRNGVQNLQINDDRVIPCRLEGSASYRPIMGSQFVAFAWQARFRSEQPFWEKTTENTDTYSKSGAGPYTDDFPANNGTAPAQPIIDIKLTSVSVTDKTITLINAGTNEEVKLHAFDWNQDDIIRFDFRNRIITDASGNPIFAGTIEGDWWELPGGGAITTLKVTHDVGGGAGMDFTTSYTEMYDVA